MSEQDMPDDAVTFDFTLEQRQAVLARLKAGYHSVTELYPEPEPPKENVSHVPVETYTSPVIEHADGSLWVKVDTSDSYVMSLHPKLYLTHGDKAYRIVFTEAEFASLASAVFIAARRVADERENRNHTCEKETIYKNKRSAWRERAIAWSERVMAWWSDVKPKAGAGKKVNDGERRVFVEDIPV